MVPSFSFSKGLQINKVNLNIKSIQPEPMKPVYGPVITVPINSRIQLSGGIGVNQKFNYAAGLVLKGTF